MPAIVIVFKRLWFATVLRHPHNATDRLTKDDLIAGPRYAKRIDSWADRHGRTAAYCDSLQVPIPSDSTRSREARKEHTTDRPAKKSGC